MKQYTLAQLALFDRCMFPDDFAAKLRDVGGMASDHATIIKLSLRTRVKHGLPLGVVWFYQTYVVGSSEEDAMADYLDKVLTDFFTE